MIKVYVNGELVYSFKFSVLRSIFYFIKLVKFLKNLKTDGVDKVAIFYIKSYL